MKKIQKILIHIVFVQLMLLCLSFKPIDKNSAIEVVNTGLQSVENEFKNDAYPVYIISDWGYNGYYNQRDVAKSMSSTSSVVSPKMIISCGDNFQVNGVQSTNDPLWTTNFELIYDHPSLMVDWHPVLGNHDYKGDTRAIIDYSKVSRRWKMPSNYYTVVKTINDSTSARFVFIDTPSMLTYYRERAADYPDVLKQNPDEQIKWIRDVLLKAKEKWVIVVGHHPLYSTASRHGNTPELISMLEPIFNEFKIDMYFCGHDHDFQHIKPKLSKIDYFVTGTGGKIRENKSVGQAQFTASLPGFTIIGIDYSAINLHFISSTGNVVYSYKKQK